MCFAHWMCMHTSTFQSPVCAAGRQTTVVQSSMPRWTDFDYRSNVGVAAVSFLVGIAVQHMCQRLRQLFTPRRQANAVQLVKDTTQQVVREAHHVSISQAAIKKCCRDIDSATMTTILAPVAFDSTLHFVDGTSRTLQYLLVLDALNFCFWPGALCPNPSPHGLELHSTYRLHAGCS